MKHPVLFAVLPDSNRYSVEPGATLNLTREGSWVVISGVTSPLIMVLMVTLFITPLITTHEPPSSGSSRITTTCSTAGELERTGERADQTTLDGCSS